LKIWAASFFPSKSIRCRLRSSINNTPELYISCKKVFVRCHRH
jgi:hypothetical protein